MLSTGDDDQCFTAILHCFDPWFGAVASTSNLDDSDHHLNSLLDIWSTVGSSNSLCVQTIQCVSCPNL